MDFAQTVEVTNSITHTENGMRLFKTSDSSVLDFFTKIGSVRNTDINLIEEMFNKSFDEDKNLTVRIMLWLRDIRQGAGERETFRTLLKFLEKRDRDLAIRVANRIPDLGRWDDLFSFDDYIVQLHAMNLLASALLNGNKLAAKWCPREKSANKHLAQRLRKHMGLNPKAYRKLLSTNTDVVENKMCNNEWGNIEYSHVPSVAMSKYRAAFIRQDSDRFNSYINDVVKGMAKVNAGAIYPHTLIFEYFNADTYSQRLGIEAQWNSLPDYIGSDAKILPICDVSPSMEGLPMLVAISLGMYISERVKCKAFKNVVMEFTSSASLIKLDDSSFEKRVNSICDIKWGMSTNFQNALSVLLNHAKKFNLSNDDMPEMLLVISDMQFDDNEDGKDNGFNTVIDMMNNIYAHHGYKLPTIVFWNVDARNNVNQSLTKNDYKNVVEVSGFSPSIMKSILCGKLDDITPYNLMLKAINVDRYDF